MLSIQLQEIFTPALNFFFFFFSPCDKNHAMSMIMMITKSKIGSSFKIARVVMMVTERSISCEGMYVEVRFIL